MTRKSFPMLVVFFLMAGASATADPRFWTNDRAITSGSERKAWPDVCMPGYVMGARDPVVVVYEQERAPGDNDIWLLLSMDHGCTWCPPRLWAGENEDETRPRVEFGINQMGKFLIHVVYERAGKVYVTADDTLDVMAGPLLCEELANLTPTTILLSRPAGNGEVDSRPRIARASRLNNRFSLFVVWQRISPSGGTSVELASNLLFGSVLGWTGPGRDLTAEIGGPGYTPDVAADTLGTPPDSASSVTVFYVDPNSGELKMSRNEKNGDPGGWNTVDLGISTANPPLAPVADSSSADFFEAAAWTGALWEQDGQGTLWLDAAQWTDSFIRAPDFDFSADEPVSAPFTVVDERALAVCSPPGAEQPSPLWTFWSGLEAPPALPEVFARGGLLNPLPPARPRDLDAYPFEPRRTAPPDPVASAAGPFSLCAWDETTGDCLREIRPAPSIEGAREVSAADGGVPPFFAVVFIDDRSGERQVVLKMTDDAVEVPTLTSVTSSCQGLLTARADVSFDRLAECPAGHPVQAEWMTRYLVYYGTAGAAGPFGGPTVIDSIGLPPGPVTTPVTGLSAGATYTFVVVGEDEARNLNPPDFNPAGNTNEPAGVQFATVTTPPCRPALALSGCGYGAIRCEMSDPWDDTRPPRPGETVRTTLSLTNGGDFEASGLTGTIEATNASVLDPPGGDLSAAAVGPVVPGATAAVAVTLRIDPDVICPAPVDISIRDLASDGGAVPYGLQTCASPFLTVDDCTIRCEPCMPGDLRSLGNTLTAVKAGSPASGIVFGWADPGDGAFERHVNAVGSKGDIPDARRLPSGSGTEACGSSGPGVSCTDGDALAGAGILFYQAVSACAPGGDAEGPM
jgi:hypothetical protein